MKNFFENLSLRWTEWKWKRGRKKILKLFAENKEQLNKKEKKNWVKNMLKEGKRIEEEVLKRYQIEWK